MAVVAASHPLERSEGQPAKQAERGCDHCAAVYQEVEVEVEVGPHRQHPSLSPPIVNVNKTSSRYHKTQYSQNSIVYIFNLITH